MAIPPAYDRKTPRKFLGFEWLRQLDCRDIECDMRLGTLGFGFLVAWAMGAAANEIGAPYGASHRRRSSARRGDTR
jgi:hypothetical protein